MKMLFLCYNKCSTCRKAKRFLNENDIEYDERDIKTNNPTESEIREWYIKSGLPLKKFFNTNGTLYKSMQLKEKLTEMTEEEQIKLLSTDGMLVKRPILIYDSKVLTGFKEEDWTKYLKNGDCI